MTPEPGTDYAALVQAARASAVRRKRGRPRGSVNASTRALVAAVESHLELFGGDLVGGLAGVFEDKTAPLPVRLAAGRALFGALAGRVLRPEGPGGQ